MYPITSTKYIQLRKQHTSDQKMILALGVSQVFSELFLMFALQHGIEIFYQNEYLIFISYTLLLILSFEKFFY